MKADTGTPRAAMRLKKGDFAAAAFVLLLAAALFFFIVPASSGDDVRVYRDGQLILTRSLNASPETIRLDGVTVRIGGGYACFVASDCPDQTCVRSGRLTRAGQVAVCAPNRVALAVAGETGLDALS